MTTQLQRVFVYGTLKKGEPNHNWFSKSRNGFYKFICKAETTTKFPLIIGTKYNIPFLLFSPGEGNYIKGEVYDVDSNVFADLDVLEDYPKWYTREIHPVKSLEDNSEINAWIYYIKNYKPDLLKQKMYDCYSSKGEHGLKYVTRFERDPNYNVKESIINLVESQ